MAQNLGTLLVDVKADTTQLIQGFNRAENAVNKTTKQMSYAVKGLIGAFVGLNTLDIAKNFTKQLDLITSANNKLKLVTKTTEEYTNAQKRLFEVAQITSSGYTETVDLYSKLSTSMSAMGKSQSDVFRTIETVNKAIAISGSTAEGASAAILQLGQAFGSGLLQGDELKSINENAQGLSKAIAEGMGVAVGELKDLGSEGKITSEILATALEKVANSTDEKYGKMSKTIAQSMQIVQNSISQVIAQFDKMTGVSNVIADNIQNVSKALDSVNSDDLESMFNTFKVGAELIVASYVALKLLKGGQSAYNTVLEVTNSISKNKIALDMAMAQAENTNQRAVLARQIATESLTSKTVIGIEVNKTMQKQFIKQAVDLETLAKKQQAYADKLEITSRRFSIATLGANAFKMALNTIPFIAITTGIGLIVEKLLSASKESDLFRDSITKTREELEKLSKAQIEVRIIGGVEELKKAEEQLSKLKQDLSKVSNDITIGGNIGGIGTIDVEKTNKKLAEQRSIIQANIDTVQYQVDKNKELLGILNDIKGEKTTYVNINTLIPKTETNVIEWLINGDETVTKKVNVEVKTKDLTDELKNILEPDAVIYNKYAKLFEDLAKTDKNTTEYRLKLQKDMNDEITNLDKEGVQKRKDAEKEKLKAVEDAENKRKDLIKESLDLTVSEVDKVNNKFLEMYNASNSTLNEEQKIAFTKKWQEEVEKVNGTLDAQKEKQDLVNQALESSTSEYDKIVTKYVAMYNAVKDNPLWDETKQNEFFNNLNKELDGIKEKFDFTATIELDTIGEDKSIQRIEKSFQDLNKSTKKYEENRKKIAKGSEDEAKNEEMFRKDQMNGYINMAGALGSMFEQGSKEAATFQAAQLSLALVEGTRAILTAGTGDPYTAIPRMAAMGIMVKSLLGNIGVALGMNSTSTTSDAFSAQTANTGTGTVLGDSKKASESITNALKTLEDFAEPQFEVLNSMNNYLESIANNIGGVSSLLIRGAGFALGEGATSYNSGFSNNVGLENTSASLLGGAGILAGAGALGGFGAMGGLSVLGPAGLALMGIDKILLGGVITNAFGSIVNSVLGGLFGKTSVSQALTDSGITFADTLLSSAIKQFEGQAFQTIATTVTKKSWLKSSSSTSISTGFAGLNDEIENQFSLVLSGLYNTVLESGRALDLSSTGLENSLNSFVVSIGKLSLKDKTGEQIQELLTNVFAQIGDDLTKTTIPSLGGFQQVGEGLFETLTRVATGIQEAEFYIDRLGTSTVKYTDIVNQQGVVGFEALAQSLIKADEATYGLNNGVVQMLDSMSTTTEELYNTYLLFGNIRDVLIATNHSASNLSSSMILGAGSISALESGTSAYMENFLSDSERIKVEMSRLSDEFKIAGYSLPQTRDAFINLINSIDTSTEAGAKAYGRLISLSGVFNDTISDVEDNLATLKQAEDEKIAIQKQAEETRLANIKTLSDRLAQIGMTDEQKLAFQRQQELATATDETSKSLLKQIYTQEDLLTAADKYKNILNTLLNTFSNLGDSVSSTIKTLVGANTDSQSATAQIKSFWEKRKEIDNLLALNGNLTDAQQNRLSELVNDVNSLATNIQGQSSISSGITQQLISNLTGLESALNLEEQILSVNIVGIASNVALVENIAGITANVPTLASTTSNYVTSDNLSTEIKDILTTIKDNLSIYPKRTFDILDNVINGNQRVKVQSN